MARWPWWLVKPRLAVVLSGGATLGAFEVGVIDVMARRGLVPDLLVGTSVGAINAAFWAVHPQPDAGERLLDVWLKCDRTTMFPDGPLPMVGRLFQRKDYLTTQRELARVLASSIPDQKQIETTPIPLAVVATEADHGGRVVLRSGPLIQAVLASSALPALWPPVTFAGTRLVDGGLVANCDLEAAVELGMTDVLLVDVMTDGIGTASSSVGEILEHSIAIAARRQTDMAIKAYSRDVRVALLRANLATKPHLGDFSLTRKLYRDGRDATERFLDLHLGPRRSVRPGRFEAAPLMWRERPSIDVPIGSFAG